jgi:glycosyltransferase involved in cell wall biosynthesis
MKKLVICSNESIVGGKFSTGVGEVSDSLGISLSKDYEVTIVCPDGNGVIARTAGKPTDIAEGIRGFTLLGARFLLCLNTDAKIRAIEQTSPDILLNFGDIDLPNRLPTRPGRVICVLDEIKNVDDKIDALSSYDAIVTVSKGYAEQLLMRGDALSELLKTKDFRGITNGILDSVLSPERGIMLTAKYSVEDMSGKELCKKRLCELYGLPFNRFIAVYMGRLIDIKGIDGVIDNIKNIYDNGGYTVIIGKGDAKAMMRLQKMKRSDGVLWLHDKVAPTSMVPILAGADFLLYPSKNEACGLMPMTACRYAAIPVTTLNGGLADNMNEDIAIIIDSMDGAAERMRSLYSDGIAEKRKAAMQADFSWATRKQGYLEVLG